MDLSLQGKVALVTGGGRGLGRSMVRGLRRPARTSSSPRPVRSKKSSA